MKNLWKNYKLLIIGVGYILALACFVYFIFLPYANRIKQKSDLIEEKIIDSQLTKAKLDKIPSMRNDYAVFQNNQNVLGVTLSQQGEVDFIKKLETLAQETNNTIILEAQDGNNGSAAKQPSSKEKKDKEKSIKEELAYKNYISLKINLKGTYESLIAFINRLENDNYYANIISLNLKKETDDSAQKTAVESNQGTNLFASSAPQPSPSNPGPSKEILNSSLEVVIYLKN